MTVPNDSQCGPPEAPTLGLESEGAPTRGEPTEACRLLHRSRPYRFPSFHEHQIAARLEDDLTRLGLTVTNDQTGPDGVGNIIAKLDGEVGQAIALSAHLDTVEPGRGVDPQIAHGVIRSDGSTVLGADCKAGIAAILESLRLVVEQGRPHGAIEVLLTFGEERGHAGAETVDLAGLEAGWAVVLDGLAPPGTIVLRAPAHSSIIGTFTGKAAHAGVQPEAGRSAIVAAAEAIRRMTLGRLDEETTANVGLIKGGSARNAVPSLARFEGEARSLDTAKLERLLESLQAAIEGAAADSQVGVDLLVQRHYDAYELRTDDLPVAVASRAAKRAGLEPTFVSTGGGSDANTLISRGLPSVVIGIGVQSAHEVDECIAIDDLMAVTEHVVHIIDEAAAVTDPA